MTRWKRFLWGALYIPNLSVAANFMALADAALSHAQSEDGSGCYWRKADEVSARCLRVSGLV